MNIEYIIALSRIKGIGDAFFKKNISKLRGQNNINKLLSVDKRITEDAINENISYAQEVVSDCLSLGISYITIFDADYPKQLLEISDPPVILYFKGNKSLLDRKVVSIIGTRKSNDIGNKIATKIGEFFTQNAVVCNGLVDGIDKWAISNMPKGACNVIGVISGGLDFEYTSSSVTKKLANLVLNNGGLLVSESEPRKKEDQFSGSKASRIQAGLSSALILVQSSTKGGSRYTVKPFAKLGRTLCVVNLSNNSEFNNSELFGANRLLINKRINGLVEFCGLKDVKALKTDEILEISTKDDYYKIINNQTKSSLFDFI